MAISNEDIIKALESMKIAELNELVKKIEEHFNVSAAAVMAAGADDKPAEEKNEFDIVLKEVGQSKVGVIKLVGQITGKGLMDAKKFIEQLPVVIKSKVSADEGEELKAKFNEIGSTVELK